MPWYWILVIVYVALVVLILLFVSGAAKLAKEAEAHDRMRPPRKKDRDSKKEHQGVA